MTSLSESLLLSKFIKTNKITTFSGLKDELEKIKDDEKCYSLDVKEDENVGLIYHNGEKHDTTEEIIALEDSTKSCIIDKKTLEPIVTQYNNIIYNDDATKYLNDKLWSDVVVYKCYEGTFIIVYNHEGKWYVSTRRCLNAKESIWVQNTSYLELFNDVIEEKFKIEDLDPNYCYHFILVHFANQNIIIRDPETREIILTMVTPKYSCQQLTMDEINLNPKLKLVFDKTIQPEIYHFSCLDEVIDYLNRTSEKDEIHKRVTSEGVIIKHYLGEIGKSVFVLLKLQTEIYQKLTKIKPNNNNVHQIYLELYQKDLLKEYLPYYTVDSSEIIRRINIAFKTLSHEILFLYFETRKKKNQLIYDKLPGIYRKVLFEIHGIFIKKKKEMDVSTEIDGTQSITIHDVYYYLKGLEPNTLRRIFYNRMMMIKNQINTGCFEESNKFITMQTYLMFQTTKDKDCDIDKYKDTN